MTKNGFFLLFLSNINCPNDKLSRHKNENLLVDLPEFEMHICTYIFVYFEINGCDYKWNFNSMILIIFCVTG